MADRLLAYIGNYTKGKDAGIYRGEVDPASGGPELGVRETEWDPDP